MNVFKIFSYIITLVFIVNDQTSEILTNLIVKNVQTDTSNPTSLNTTAGNNRLVINGFDHRKDTQR